MRAVTYSLTASVPVAMDRVFDLLIDPARMPEWVPACRAASAPTPLERGSLIKLQFAAREAELEVIELKRPSAFAWVEREPRRHWRTSFRLNFAGGLTSVTVQQIWMPPSLGTWLRAKFFPKRNVAARLDRLVQDLRKAVSK